MPNRSKKYRAALATVDRTKRYTVEEAISLVKAMPAAKYDETVEVAINLGINPKHADQMVRGAVVLPNGTGKVNRVLVFARGEKEKEALDAGADYAGGDELIEKVKEGWFEFDTCIATPNMMVAVGKIGKLLGPRGLMPNPKVGTVTMDVKQAVTDAKGGQVQFKVEKAGVIHAGVGKVSFDAAKLEENIRAFVDAVQRAKPTGAKGTYMKKVSISSTMGPGVSVDVATTAAV